MWECHTVKLSTIGRRRKHFSHQVYFKNNYDAQNAHNLSIYIFDKMHVHYLLFGDWDSLNLKMFTPLHIYHSYFLEVQILTIGIKYVERIEPTSNERNSTHRIFGDKDPQDHPVRQE